MTEKRFIEGVKGFDDYDSIIKTINAVNRRLSDD